ncbi:DUF2721 domain-containing protein [Blastomonas sp.]|uniref:DUF2721 domain-containing protein n=1 Tax=Blastomonas sp. TaxID=1909299 RepID=UPI0035938D05
MFNSSDQIGQIGELIQLAMAPAFLLVATGNILQLFAGRLARVIDRERVQMAAFYRTEGEEHTRVVLELRNLDRRAGVVNSAILLGTLGAMTVSLLIATLFIMGLTGLDLSVVIAAGFILAMLLLIVGLTLFVVEVRLANRNIHVEKQLLELEDEAA